MEKKMETTGVIVGLYWDATRRGYRSHSLNS